MKTVTVINTGLELGDVLSPAFALAYEQAMYGTASGISEYRSGIWDVTTLTNEGWYFNLKGTELVPCVNDAAWWSGNLSPTCFSICVNIYVCSHLSFAFMEAGQEKQSKIMADNYYKLRDYFLQDDSSFSKDEISSMLSFID